MAAHRPCAAGHTGSTKRGGNRERFLRRTSAAGAQRAPAEGALHSSSCKLADTTERQRNPVFSISFLLRHRDVGAAMLLTARRGQRCARRSAGGTPAAGSAAPCSWHHSTCRRSPARRQKNPTGNSPYNLDCRARGGPMQSCHKPMMVSRVWAGCLAQLTSAHQHESRRNYWPASEHKTTASFQRMQCTELASGTAIQVAIEGILEELTARDSGGSGRSACCSGCGRTARNRNSCSRSRTACIDEVRFSINVILSSKCALFISQAGSWSRYDVSWHCRATISSKSTGCHATNVTPCHERAFGRSECSCAD